MLNIQEPKAADRRQENVRISSAACPNRGTILAVDDRPRNIELLQTTLGDEGYEVIPATSGTQALECVAKKVPDLILLDVMMPDMDGFEVCRRLKHDARTADVAVLFLSAAGDKHSIVRGIQMGGVDYVTKPFAKEELLARVNTHVTLRHLMERNRNLLRSRHRLIAEEMEDLKRPLRAIAQNLGDIARSARPAAKQLEKLIDETLSIANHALDHVCRDLEELGSYVNSNESIEFPVSAKQLQELIGQWYLSSRRRRLSFKMSRFSHEVEIACRLSPLTHVINLIMSQVINTAEAGQTIHVKMRVVDHKLEVCVEQSEGGEGHNSRQADHDVRWVMPPGYDPQLVQEAERLGATLRVGTRPTNDHVILFTLPVQGEES